MVRTRTLAGAFALASCLLVVLVLAAPAAGQDKPPVGTAGKAMSAEEKAMMDAMMKAATPGKPHEMLSSMAGDWDFTVKMWMDPSAPPTESKGSATYSMMLGGRYLHGDYRGDMMGMPFEGKGVTAYDNVTGQYQATWLDNMSTMLMYMTGKYDPATKSYTFTGVMPDPTKGGMKVKVRQVLRVTSSDQQVMEMYETRGGKEVKTMEINYTRKK